MGNRVYTKKGCIIAVIFEGNQNGKSVSEVYDRMQDLIAIRIKKRKRICITLNLNGAGTHDSQARLIGLRMIRNLRYDRIAAFGGDFFTRGVAKLIIAASRNRRVRYCDTKEEAEAWVKGAGSSEG